MIRFAWDLKKANLNGRKHGVSFYEAQNVFSDPHGRLISDPDHSEAEDRFLLLGMSSEMRILVVSHCYREGEEVVRIISARKANERERKTYGEFL